MHGSGQNSDDPLPFTIMILMININNDALVIQKAQIHIIYEDIN